MDQRKNVKVDGGQRPDLQLKHNNVHNPHSRSTNDDQYDLYDSCLSHDAKIMIGDLKAHIE